MGVLSSLVGTTTPFFIMLPYTTVIAMIFAFTGSEGSNLEMGLVVLNTPIASSRVALRALRVGWAWSELGFTFSGMAVAVPMGAMAAALTAVALLLCSDRIAGVRRQNS
jgi:hypothetical protein